MKTMARRRVVGAGSLLLVAMTAVACAPAGAGVRGDVLGRGSSPDAVVARTAGATDVIVREITIAPGASTGWHYHDGPLIAVVKSGTLTRTLHDCSIQVTGAGGALVEPAGRELVHLGRNLGAEPLVLLVTYVLPAGQPLSRDAPEPACAR
jgi:quercetin dioxygenase-like cupin family protein